MRLLKPPGRVAAGEVWLDDVNLMTLSEDDMRQVRLGRIALVPQGSMNSLNPVMRIKEQIADALKDHGVRLSKRDVAERVPRSPAVGWPAARSRQHVSPRTERWHETTGLHCHRHQFTPQVIIADEPTSALDVVVQKQVMETLARMQKRPGKPP